MKLRTDLTLRQFGKEFVIVDPGQGISDVSKIFTLNTTAGLIWTSLQGKEFTVHTIKKLLTDHYEVETKKAEVDAYLLVLHLREQGLLIE
ncbi:MAG: hypothetical protein K0R59_65 [Sphingobacterium sp.]|jgi:hypothetical protein|nr:hypothetical protein [Sphingobacterium sp.]